VVIPPPSIYYIGRMPEKIIRDPVHDVIAFDLARPVEALLFSLVNTIELQRLRRIRQLGLASLAYPGADHCRYAHSLGVMQTARRMLQRLGTTAAIDDGLYTVCLAAALLHDLGHGPFSHVFERVTGIDHEAVTRQLVEDPDTDVHAVLSGFDARLPRMLVEFLECHPARTFLHDVLSSQLDADRFDYLLRDTLMTGAQYGNFDLSWLLHALAVHQPTQRLVVEAKGISAAEAYLQARYHLYRNVYFHKVVRSAEGMLRLTLQRAARLAAQGRLPWPPRDHPVSMALAGQSLSAHQFLDLDDVSILHCFKLWRNGPDATLASLCSGLLDRRLFKVIDLTDRLGDAPVGRILAVAQHAIRAAGGDPAYAMFLDEPADTPYRSEAADDLSGGRGIFVQDARGNLSEFARVSPLVEALNRQLTFRRLHVAEPFRPAVAQAVLQGDVP